MSDVRARMLKIAERLFAGGEVTSAWVQAAFGVSHATAKRDLVIVEGQLPVRTRTVRTSPTNPAARKFLRIVAPRNAKQPVAGNGGA